MNLKQFLVETLVYDEARRIAKKLRPIFREHIKKVKASKPPEGLTAFKNFVEKDVSYLFNDSKAVRDFLSRNKASVKISYVPEGRKDIHKIITTKGDLLILIRGREPSFEGVLHEIVHIIDLAKSKLSPPVRSRKREEKYVTGKLAYYKDPWEFNAFFHMLKDRIIKIRKEWDSLEKIEAIRKFILSNVLRPAEEAKKLLIKDKHYWRLIMKRLYRESMLPRDFKKGKGKYEVSR